MADLERRMTPEQLAEIQACADAATGGPWHARGWAVAGAGAGVFVAFDLKTEDAEFVARARVDVPDLLAEVRQLREDRDRWRSNRRNAEAVVEEVGDELGEMRKERDSLRDDLNVTRGMLTAARRHADEAKAERDRFRVALEDVALRTTQRDLSAVAKAALTGASADLVGKVAKTLGRDWSALPDWELRAAARFTLAAIQADGKVVVSREDLDTYLNRNGQHLPAEVAALNRLRAVLADQQDGDGS